MTTTYVLRHGRTNYSKRYLVNGDPAKPIFLNEEGRQSLSRAWSTIPLHTVATWLTGEFPRARQTTDLLMGVPTADPIIDARLNELDYGAFEGLPFLEYAVWLDSHGSQQRPPDARESQQEGIRRMLAGLLGALEYPGPRVLVGHGLLVSALQWRQTRAEGESMPLFFLEAPYAEPIGISDDELPQLVTELLNDIDASVREETLAGGSDAVESWLSDGSAVATVDPVSPSHSLDKKDLPHA